MKKLFALVVCGLALTCGGNHPSFAQTAPNQDAVQAARNNLEWTKQDNQRMIDESKAIFAGAKAKLDLSTQVGRWDAEILDKQLANRIKETQELVTGPNLARAEKLLTDAMNGKAVSVPDYSQPGYVPPSLTNNNSSARTDYVFEERVDQDEEARDLQARASGNYEQYLKDKKLGKVTNINQKEMNSLGGNGQLAGIGGGGGTTKQSSGGSGGGWKWH